ncbi:hypothetical protein B0H16DRAFT_1564820 [Mycena metata]|uniref:Protein kinase domain-containing protein n=1 Tax=Mycena metata TaxID=1033252 RepID=A0AAD7IF23_9AGAR|nr:hypothetical protein B0H16DRAFT_1564820 [Mycena metata]
MEFSIAAANLSVASATPRSVVQNDQGLVALSESIADLENVHLGDWFRIHQSLALYIFAGIKLRADVNSSPPHELFELSKQWAEWDTITSLANYHSVVQVLFRYLGAHQEPTTSNRTIAIEVSELLSRDISSVFEQLILTLCNSDTYKRFLSCRGDTAQRLLDLLQDLLDSSYESTSRPLLFKALLRLSGECGLHPTCFALSGLTKVGPQVGGGGFGDIWKGLVGGQTVAVKSMRQFLDDDVKASMKMFAREAAIWRQLSHPNLLPFFGLYTLDSRLSLVSPWMDNGDLKHFLRSTSTGIDRLSLIIDVGTGLSYLHNSHVVHGDLKPANILITPSGRACITDFGLSSITDGLSFSFTRSSHTGRPGTVRYQAPELLSNESSNHFASDVYAFGCLTYEILTGRVPFFEISNDVAIILKVIQGVRPSRAEGILLDSLWFLLDDCWKHSPGMRPAMNEIIERLISQSIGAEIRRSQPDWDEAYSARFRRSVQEWPLLPSILEIEQKIPQRTTSALRTYPTPLRSAITSNRSTLAKSNQIGLGTIIASLNPIVSVLNELNDALGPPFVAVISNTILSLITALQRVKQNKEECLRLIKDIYGPLHAIVSLHLKSEIIGSLPPADLMQVGKFTETLHKIQTFVEMQQGGNRLKQFFRQNEMNTLLKDCQAGLQQAITAFNVDPDNTTSDIQTRTEGIHQELLELISTLADGIAVESSESFSLVPSRPLIFHGREVELEKILKLLATSERPARIAILGGGGMGKTSLAKASLHISSIHVQRFFIAANSATTSIELSALIGSYVGLRPGRDMTRSLIQYFLRAPSTLLVLDNLESAWEPMESRAGVEDFLAMLSEIPQLALIITLLGCRRPGKVAWSDPLLPPLEPLSPGAARQTFIDIAEDFHDEADINHLLSLTDNVPLVVNLMAHLVDSEGCANVLRRWETEKTSMLSQGNDKRSNLHASITGSLSSPRLSIIPGARELLSLISVVPEGLSEGELLQCNFPIRDIIGCKAILLELSLAYMDDKNQLGAFLVVREYMQHFHPPGQHLIQPLIGHLQKSHQQERLNGITSYLGL